MTQDQQTNPNEEAENFFAHEYAEIANSTSNASSDDRKSLAEQDFLFAGGLDDIDVWIKHEEQRIKFLEFKLKQKDNKLKFLEFELRKKTLSKETRSTYKDRKNERKLRKENAKKAFWFSAIWAVFIGFFILLHGLKCIKIPLLSFIPRIEYDFLISETEFMFVCGTLTASILIFYLTVIKNLFPNKPDIKISDDKKEDN